MLAIFTFVSRGAEEFTLRESLTAEDLFVAEVETRTRCHDQSRAKRPTAGEMRALPLVCTPASNTPRRRVRHQGGLLRRARRRVSAVAPPALTPPRADQLAHDHDDARRQAAAASSRRPRPKNCPRTCCGRARRARCARRFRAAAATRRSSARRKCPSAVSSSATPENIAPTTAGDRCATRLFGDPRRPSIACC